jgi:hypothetical protein
MSQPKKVRYRYWGVSIYFLLVGPSALYALAVLYAFGDSMAGMSSVGSSDRGRPYLFWGLGAYCLAGAIAGCVSRARRRVLLAWIAHAAVFVVTMLETRNFIGGLAVGGFFSALLAVPFGLAWLILLADSIWKKRVVGQDL